MEKAQTDKYKKIGCIETLRAFAVSFVVVHHLNANLLPRAKHDFFRYFEGWVGVDLFFAISGFVIARSLLPQFGVVDSKRSFRATTLQFWTKRAFRLLPSAWLWLAIIFALTIFYNQSGVFGSVVANTYATVVGVLNVANFRFADAFGNYFYGASFVYWSLSLEEQFYLLFPFLLILFRKWLPYFLVFVLVVQVPIEKNLWGMAFRTEAIILGVLLAYWERTRCYKRVEPTVLRSRLLLLPIILSLLTLLVTVSGIAFDIKPYHFFAAAMISIVLVWLASYNQSYIMPFSSVAKITEYIGARSYAIYLIHIPVFFVIRETCFRMQWVLPNSVMVILAIGIILIFAELNYQFVEVPLRKQGSKLAQKYVLQKEKSAVAEAV